MSLLFSKAVAQLILPPAGLLLAAAAGLVCYRRYWARFVLAVIVLVFWLLALEPVHDVLLQPLENRYAALPDTDRHSWQTAQAIVLLGGGIYAQAPEFGGRDSLDKDALMRTVYAARLAQQGDFDVYTTGGIVLNEDARPEGVIMAEWLRWLGVSPERIHIEAEAKNTWLNARYIHQMLAPSGIRRILLVTSAYHMSRAVWCFQQQGFEVVAAPVAFRVRRRAYDLLSWLPSATVLNESCDALHEYLGILWYRIRYGLLRKS